MAAERPARAIEVSRHGGPDVLRLVEREPAQVPPGHVRVKIAFAGVNFADIHLRTGRYPGSPPFVLGSEGSGRVVERASDVTSVGIGQRMAWQGVAGSYANGVVAPARQLIAVPPSLPDDRAAALPCKD